MANKEHGKHKRYGRNKPKCERYEHMGTRERNKLRRVLRCNGEEAATAYADEHGLMKFLRALLAKE